MVQANFVLLRADSAQLADLPASLRCTVMNAASLHPATIVWCDAHGTGRHIFALFRRRFTLATVPARADLTLFGDTRYRLRVNGQVACYGPARFAPAFPESDTVDLTPWLRVGDNEITVEVNHRGAPSFEHAASSGGFIAWGRAGDADLATPGAWECQRSDAWDGEAMAISFAQGPLESCDTRLLSDNGWHSPVARDHQDIWGAFRPRSIPHLDLRETLPQRCLGGYSLAREWRFGCRISGPGTRHGDKRRAAYACCIHSPNAQEVTLGLFWGPHYLNGTELACRTHPQLGNRQEATLSLRAGWNVLYGEPEVMVEGWALLFTLPEDRGLVVAAHPRLDDPAVLRHSASLNDADLAQRRGLLPTTVAEIPELEWTLVARTAPAPGPSHQPGWDAPATSITVPFDQSVIELPAGDHALVYDLGHEYLGHVQVVIDAPAGTIIDVTSCERLRPDGLVAQFGSMWMHNESDRFITHGGPQTWEGFNPRGGRYLQVTVRGATAPVSLRRIAVRETLYPLRQVGAFSCSDTFLTWVWRTGAATLRACAEDAFLDCPSRERGLYTFDAVVEHHVMRGLTADDRLIRRCLWLYAMNQRADGHLQDVTPAHKPVTLGDFSLFWVLGVQEYHQRSNDRSLVDEVWPHLVKLLDSPVWITDADGLVDGDAIVRAHPTITFFSSVTGLNGILNSLWCMALDRAARLAAATGRGADAIRFRARGDAALAAFRRWLWNEADGCFANAVHQGSAIGDHLCVTVYALAFGLADDAQASRCIDYLDRRSATPLAVGEVPELGPNNAHFFLNACAAQHRPDLAERWIHRAFASNLRGGAWTLWEHVAPNTSLCHAWSAAPVWWLSEQVLGACWDAARPAQVLIAPASATLTWAAGTVPHPQGPLHIRWELRGGQLLLNVTAPPGVVVTCQPRGRLADYALVVEGVATAQRASGA